MVSDEKNIPSIKRSIVSDRKYTGSIRKDMVSDEKNILSIKRSIVSNRKYTGSVRKNIVSDKKDIPSIKRSIVPNRNNTGFVKKDIRSVKKDIVFQRTFPVALSGVRPFGGGGREVRIRVFPRGRRGLVLRLLNSADRL